MSIFLVLMHLDQAIHPKMLMKEPDLLIYA
jgi:hypothetical protein